MATVARRAVGDRCNGVRLRMQRRIPLHSLYDASAQILPRPLLVVDFLEGLLALRAAVGITMTGGGCRGVSPSALVQRLLSIGGRELNFKLMDLVPLGVSSPTLRYHKKLLQPSAGGHRFWCVHGGIIPSFASAVSPARGEPGWKRAHAEIACCDRDHGRSTRLVNVA